ncbi:hypothetical protein G6F31_012091 [Rhizopus arrhizus]|nr:hypothetical protein G6F31_012091 [Rhizopus arrhizus]
MTADMIELNPVRQRITDLTDRVLSLRGPDVWNHAEYAQNLGRERSSLEKTVGGIASVLDGLTDATELLELAESEQDEDTALAVVADLDKHQAHVEKLEFQRMFSGEMDNAAAFVDIQAGAGGTEAQDWAEILLRMYLRWCESRGWKTELMEVSGGDVAGIKSATLRVEGDYAYGWLKTETGVHRLVRKSPFDSDNRRHTSFTSVFVSPEIDDNIDITINPADLRTDVYRSSGAGGQHVNKTESAVRITHIPTNIVVACQTGRSQHQNRDNAMKMLAAKLYELEIQKRNAEKDAVEATKSDIGWGSQIRNYVLDQSRIKDLRTGIERSDTQKVLDGDLDEFVEASLKAGLAVGSKRELGGFLKACRARVDPTTLGLPAGRRRTPGLKREEVALAIGVSVSWYTWIEQGREVRASPEVLERLAQVLRMSDDERAYAFALSGYGVPLESPDESVTDGLRQLVEAMQPIPAYVRNTRFDILAWNPAIAELFVDYSQLAPHERNTLRLMFLYPPYRTLILNWEEMTRGLLAGFRAAMAQAPDKAPFLALVEDIAAHSEEFRQWWPEHDVRRFDEGAKKLNHPTRGLLDLQYVALVPESRHDLSLVTYLPRK